MCGLLGVIKTNNTDKHKQIEKFLKVMLVVDQLRGEDATGIFSVDKPTTKQSYSSRPSMFKRGVNAMDFLAMHKVKAMLSDAADKHYFVGHNRAATRGSTHNLNAHPFATENLTMVHNGTVHSFGKFASDAYPFDVDSAALAVLIDKHGLVETLKEISGAYALIWHDVRDDSLNIIRNSERPLLMGETLFGYVLGSEEWMINSAAGYAELEVKDINPIPEHTHLKVRCEVEYENNSLKVEYVKETFDYSEELRPKYYQQGNWTGYGGHSYARGPQSRTKQPASGTTKALDSANASVLKQYGLDIGKEVQFSLDLFRPYNEFPNWGDAFGYAEIGPVAVSLGAFLERCPAEFFDLMEEQDYGTYDIVGKIVGVEYRESHCNTKVHVPYVRVEGVSATILSEEDAKLVKVTPKIPKGKLKAKTESTIDIEFEDYNIEDENIIDAEYTCCAPGGAIVKYKDAEDWLANSKSGCVNCGDDLSPRLINKKTGEILNKGNAMQDYSGVIFCDDCWFAAANPYLH